MDISKKLQNTEARIVRAEVAVGMTVPRSMNAMGKFLGDVESAVQGFKDQLWCEES